MAVSSPHSDDPPLHAIYKAISRGAKPLPPVEDDEATEDEDEKEGDTDDDEEEEAYCPDSPCTTASLYTDLDPVDCDWPFQEAQGSPELPPESDNSKHFAFLYDLFTEETVGLATLDMPARQSLPPPVCIVKGAAPQSRQEAEPPMHNRKKRSHSPLTQVCILSLLPTC
jgi:hypothetical protein